MVNYSTKISVIIPCYKVEQYLGKCVNSVLESSFKDFEIILVDDGSPDKTGEIADTLAQRNNRIKVIHQQNGGVVKAREAGVEVAIGEWITFVDSDDSITSNALEDLYNASIGKNTDIVIGFPLGKGFPNIPENYSIEQYRADIIAGTRIQAAPWGRLIRRSILTPFLFDIPRKVRLGDDMIFNIRCAFATSKAPVMVKSYVYDYYINEGSITNTNMRDPEYEQYFHEMRMLSIPSAEQIEYMKSTIENRFVPIRLWSYSNPKDTKWMDTAFVSSLRNDISKTSYTLRLKKNVMLNMKNTLFRILFISLFKGLDKIKSLI